MTLLPLSTGDIPSGLQVAPDALQGFTYRSLPEAFFLQLFVYLAPHLQVLGMSFSWKDLLVAPLSLVPYLKSTVPMLANIW